jgi:hypothetical protein
MIKGERRKLPQTVPANFGRIIHRLAVCFLILEWQGGRERCILSIPCLVRDQWSLL